MDYEQRHGFEKIIYNGRNNAVRVSIISNEASFLWIDDLHVLKAPSHVQIRK
jgi:hypothetical protein